MAETQVERLERAGIVKAADLTAEEVKTLNALSDQEVQVLIQIKDKVGLAPTDRDKAKPNFIV